MIIKLFEMCDQIGNDISMIDRPINYAKECKTHYILNKIKIHSNQ